MIRIDGSEKVYLGSLKTEEEAHQVYVKKYTEISGDFNRYSKENLNYWNINKEVNKWYFHKSWAKLFKK